VNHDLVRTHLLGLLLPLAMVASPGGMRTYATSPAAPGMHSDDTVRVGCSGGHTGGGSGNTITRAGQLSGYTRELRTGDKYTQLRRDSAAAASVFTELERIRFRALQHRQIGNVTCVLELRDAAGSHYVAWLKGRPPTVLEPVLAVLERAFGDDRRWWP
jgi:hypothetical protein